MHGEGAAMKRMARVLICVAALIGLGGSVAWPQDGGITIWPKGVPPAGTTRAKFGDTHAMMISHRVVTGRVEVHQAVADVVVVQSGTATLVTGGEVVDPLTTGPNEIGGSSIKGGVSRTVSAGDVYEIPAGVPHQYLLAPGGQITCLLVKVMKQ
jgi:mannose-6-phosphate isomerase-like protein (cupin superfamily)